MPRDNPLTIDFANAEAILIADLDGLHHNPDGVALDPVIPANVNFELRWSGPFTREVSLRDAVNGFRGLFKRNSATLNWSATRAGFQFVSDAANTSTTVFAEVGRESKGIFF